jgi:hypothetical protein
MMGTKYTASLSVNNTSIFDGFSDDLQSLIVRFTTLLCVENSQACITIKNYRGKVVYRSRKVSGEE